METTEDNETIDNRIRVFRWYFYIALLQFLLYFTVPLVVFPSKVAFDVNIVSALTLGILVGGFFMIVNFIGLYLDTSRRVLHVIILSLIAGYFVWVAVSWAYIDRMDYLLR